MTSIARHVQTVDPPWIQLLVLRQDQAIDLKKQIGNPSNLLVGTIDGNKCRNHNELFSEFASVLRFPTYFGNNWDALDECLTDLEWAPAGGYVLLFENAEMLLTNDTQEEYGKFIRIMKKVGEEWSIPQVGQWSRDAIPFHVILMLKDHKKQIHRDWGIPTIGLNLD